MLIPRALLDRIGGGEVTLAFRRWVKPTVKTGGTLQVQPLDNPSARLTFAEPHGEYRGPYQDVRLPKYPRYVGDAADMAKILRGEKASDFSYDHDLAVQETLLRACGMPLT